MLKHIHVKLQLPAQSAKKTKLNPKLHIIFGNESGCVKKVHNLRLRKVLACWETPFPECYSRPKLRLRESQMIFAEFMDLFSSHSLSPRGIA